MMHFHSRPSSQRVKDARASGIAGVSARRSRGGEVGGQVARVEAAGGNDLSPSGAKILPRVLVPPVEHPDGNRAARRARLGEGGSLRSSYRRVYNFRWVRS